MSIAWAQVLHPKVLTVAMFENEASLWLEHEALDQTLDIPGSFSPLYCNASGEHCLVITGMGIANASATIMALGLSEALDLTQTYLLVAGIAGVPPSLGTLGSAAWAEWVVDGDLAHQIDAREMPETWEYPYFHLGCSEPWCEEGFAAGTEVFHLNPVLTEWAYRLSQGVELATNSDAQAYAAHYPEGSAARELPSVLKCDSLAASTYWHGTRLSEWASWWTEQWTDGQGTYCMSNMEDSATLTALTRLAELDKVDLERVMVLRTASDFDQPYPGQTAQESIRATTGGFMPSIKNAYRVGNAVAQHILENWDEWRGGVPALRD